MPLLEDPPVRVPLASKLTGRGRDFLTDSRIVNAYAEYDDQIQGYKVYQRPGLIQKATTLSPAQGRGMANVSTNSAGPNALFGVFGNKIYSLTSTGVPGFGFTLDTSLGFINFQEIRRTTGNNQLTVFDSVSGYYLNAGTFSKITDPDFPTDRVDGVAYLDGTTYVMDKYCNIWGSKNLDDVTAWSALNLIIARANPDQGIAIRKHLVYVLAFKQYNLEVFYDAGNPIGSPLAPVQGANITVGCYSADTIQEIDDEILWMTNSKKALPQIAIMRNLQHQIVSTPSVERVLSKFFTGFLYSFTFKLAGHRFYCITSKTLNITLVFDIDQNLWYIWTDPNGNYWPYVGVGFFNPATYDDTGASIILQHETNGQLYSVKISEEVFNDAGSVFPVDIYTLPFDGGIDRRKHLTQLRFNADQKNAGIIKVRVSDDDYQTWTNFRSVNLGIKRPVLNNMGSFYKRAFHFRKEGNDVLRLSSVDMQLDYGAL